MRMYNSKSFQIHFNENVHFKNVIYFNKNVHFKEFPNSLQIFFQKLISVIYFNENVHFKEFGCTLDICLFALIKRN